MGIEAIAVEPFRVEGWAWVVPFGEVGYFADTTATGSLANWVATNIDPSARGPTGLAIFSTERETTATAAWREELLIKAWEWHTAAQRLRGRCSMLRHPYGDLEVVDEAGTLAYLEWLAELLRFAEIVYATGSPVEVREDAPPRP